MSGEVVDRCADSLFIERLHAEFTPKENETSADVLGRAAVAAAEFDDRQLSEDELNYVHRLLPRWEFYTATIRARSFGVARRTGALPNSRQLEAVRELGISADGPRRSFISTDGTRNVVLLARQALTAADIATIFKVEQANDIAQISSALTPPKPKRKAGARPTETKIFEVVGGKKLELSTNELAAIELLAYPRSKASEKLKLTTSTFNKRLYTAQERMGIDQRELIVRSLQANLIDLNPLPATKSDSLGDEQRCFIEKYSFTKQSKVADAEGVDGSTISRKWKIIYQTLGLPESHRAPFYAFLALWRDTQTRAESD